eukprot:ANDGO_01466.mRNA.1 hypothetical protein
MVFLLGSMELITRMSYINANYPVWYVKFCEGMMMPMSSWTFPILNGGIAVPSLLGYPAETVNLESDPNLEIAALDQVGTYACLAVQTVIILLFTAFALAAGFTLVYMVIFVVALLCRVTLWKSIPRAEQMRRKAAAVLLCRCVFGSLFFMLYSSMCLPLSVAVLNSFTSFSDSRPVVEQVFLAAFMTLYFASTIFLWMPLLRWSQSQVGTARSACFAFSGYKDSRSYWPFFCMTLTVLDVLVITPGVGLRCETQLPILIIIALLRMLGLVTLRPHHSLRDAIIDGCVFFFDFAQLICVYTFKNAPERSNSTELAEFCLVLAAWQMATVLAITVISLVDVIINLGKVLVRILRIFFSGVRRRSTSATKMENVDSAQKDVLLELRPLSSLRLFPAFSSHKSSTSRLPQLSKSFLERVRPAAAAEVATPSASSRAMPPVPPSNPLPWIFHSHSLSPSAKPPTFPDNGKSD